MHILALLLFPLIGVISYNYIEHSLKRINDTDCKYNDYLGNGTCYRAPTVTYLSYYGELNVNFRDICNRFTYTLDDLRCIYSMGVTRRLMRMIYSFKSIDYYNLRLPEESSVALHEGILHAYSYLYDAFDAYSGGNVCIFGAFELDLLVFATEFEQLNSISYFVLNGSVPDGIMDRLSRAQIGPRFSIYFNIEPDNLNKLDLPNVCSLVHILSSVSNNDLQELSDILRLNDNSGNNFSIFAVEQNYADSSKDWLTNRLNDGKLFSQYVERLEILKDSIGFLHSLYFNDYFILGDPNYSIIHVKFNFDYLGECLVPGEIAHIINQYEETKSLLRCFSKVTFDLSDEVYDQPIIISYVCNVMAETALGLQFALLEIGFRNVFVIGNLMMHQSSLLLSYLKCQLRNTVTNVNDLEFLQIILIPMEPQLLLKNYITFHFEQTWSVYLLSHVMAPRYMDLISRAIDVWAFSDTLGELLQGKLNRTVATVPVFADTARGLRLSKYGGECVDNNTFTPRNNELRDLELHLANGTVTQFSTLASFLSYKDLVGEWRDSPDNTGYYYLDALMFGFYSERRRKAVYEWILVCCLLEGIDCGEDPYVFTNHTIPNLDSTNVLLISVGKLRIGVAVGDWLVLLTDSDRDYLVQRSKVVINMHADDMSDLEIHRIYSLFSLGTVVISERSMFDKQTDNDAAFAGFFVKESDSECVRVEKSSVPENSGSVIFVDHYRDIPVMLYSIINCPNLLQDLREIGLNKYYKDLAKRTSGLNASVYDVAARLMNTRKNSDRSVEILIE